MAVLLCYEGDNVSLTFIHVSVTVTPSDTLIRRSISQQKTGVSITIDDPVRTARQPSPPRGKVSSIVHISNLVREDQQITRMLSPFDDCYSFLLSSSTRPPPTAVLINLIWVCTCLSIVGAAHAVINCVK